MSYDLTNPDKPVIVKDPDAFLDYSVDLTDWAGTDTIDFVDAIVDGVEAVGLASVNGKIVTAWLRGGVAGTTASCTFRFGTNTGRKDDRTIYLKIKQR